MTTFYVLRHGETDWNRNNNRYCGRTDVSLSQAGREQAQAAASFLASLTFDAVYSSPLARAVETAQLVSSQSEESIVRDSRLLEVDFGLWEGKTKDEIRREHAENWEAWHTDPSDVRAGETGETAIEAYSRALSFFQEANRKQHETVLVVAHNTINRLLITGSFGVPFHLYRKFHQSNTGISIVDMTSEKLDWVQINCMLHLQK